MPRVDGTYAAPHPDVIPDTTIESDVHNDIVHDLVFDANFPRPVIAGGTGGISPTEARANLSVEVRGVVVTNYDSHVFEVGSFFSQAGATAAPTVPDPFVGVCLRNSVTDDLWLSAVSQTTGVVYNRRRTAGVWGAWTTITPASIDAMVAGVQVTDYNSHVWESGSFWSAPGTTGAPKAGASFTGYAALVNDDQNYVSLLATDQLTGFHYTRVKNATWIDWAGADIGDKVSRAGDTMTGLLTLSGNPTAPLHATTKQYVDTAIGSVMGMFSTELPFTRSLSQHMTRLFTTTSSQAWTMSMWVKRVGLGTHQALFGVETGGTPAGKLHMAFAGGNELVMFGGAAGDVPVAVGPTYTDTNLWLNIVWTAEAGAPSLPRVHNLYVNNGSALAAIIAGSGLNNAETHYIGQPGYYPDVIMKDVVFVDGAQVPPTSFGENVGGVWTPKFYNGPYGANGFKLNFGNRYAPATTNLGRDVSGNNNHWTAVNF